MVLNNLAVMAKNRGRFKEALNYLKQSLSKQGADPVLRVLMYSNLGNLHRNWGELKLAAACYEKVLTILEEKGDNRGAVSALVRLGEVHAALGDSDKALKSYFEGLRILRKIGAPVLRLQNLIGSVYLDLGDVKKAEPYLKEAKYNSSLGRLSLAKSDYRSAKRYFKALEKSALRFNRSEDLLTAYIGLGRACEGIKDLASAENYYKKGLELSEEIRSTRLLTERRGFATSPVNGFLPSVPAKGLIRVRLKTGKGDMTIFPSEVTRAREFSDRIAQHGEKGKLGVPPEVLAQEESLFNKLAALRKARSVIPKDRDPDRFNRISAQIALAEKKRPGVPRENVRGI